MTAVKFLYCKDMIKGFSVTGHSTKNSEDENGRLVCAAISSAAYMTVNTLTEIIMAECELSVEDGFLSVNLKNKISESQAIIKGFKLHIEGLCDEYNKNIKIESEEK